MWSPTWCWSSCHEHRPTRDHLAPTPPHRPGAAPPDRGRRPRLASAAAAARAGRAHPRARPRRCRLARAGVRARLHRARTLHRAGRRWLHLGDPRRRRRRRARTPGAGHRPGSRPRCLCRAADRSGAACAGRRRRADRRSRARRRRRAPRLALGAVSGARIAAGARPVRAVGAGAERPTPDYAQTYVRFVVERSGLERPIIVAAVVRPEWLDAVASEPGVGEDDVATALSYFARHAETA